MHKIHQDPIINKKIQKSLNFSILDGAFFFVMMGFAEQYFQAFALFMNATVFQSGIVYTVPMFFGSIFQLLSHWLLHITKSRKRLIVYLAVARTLLFIPLIFVFSMGTFRVWILLLIISIYYTLNFFGFPAWTSWMGDLVDDNKRGAYFGKRNKIGNFVSLLSVIIAGLVLRYFENINPYIGFLIIFIVAFFGSLLSTIFVGLKYDAPYIESNNAKFGLIEFTKRMRKTNYGRFVMYNFFLYFSVFLAAPYFTPYMLTVLKLNYLEFMISTSLVVLFKFLSMPMWGYFGDNYGNKKTLVLSGLLVVFLPLIWLLTPKFGFVIFIVQSLAGIAWGGFEITTLNFTFDTTKPQKRARCASFLTFYRGIAIFLGGLIGGLLINKISFFGSSFFAIFIISSLFRLIFAVPILKTLNEVRTVKHISYKNLLIEMVSMLPRGIQEIGIGVKKKTLSKK